MTEDYFTRGEKEFLLKIARATLEKFVTEGERYEPQTVNQKLWEKMGVFVTLTKKSELRGCIGYNEAIEPLILAIRDNTILAARDSRFDPIERGELEDINIEVSILSELERTSFDSIKKGDGVVIKKDISGATYLPQVWDDLPKKKEFFESLCQKAGFGKDVYLDEDIEIYKYSVVKFSELTSNS